MKFKRGFSLLELILAVAIFSLSSFALATMMIDTNISNKQIIEKTEALSHIRSGSSLVQNVRDCGYFSIFENNNDSGITGDCINGYSLIPGGNLIDDKYTMTYSFSDYNSSTSTKEVVISITSDPPRPASITAKSLISDYIFAINEAFDDSDDEEVESVEPDEAETIIATGGTITYADADGLNPADTPYENGYKIHTFTDSGNFAVTSGSGNIQVLVVAGGGGGGGNHGGGGGAGGICYQASREVTLDDYTVTVGTGGGGRQQHGGASSGTVGGDSIFDAITALGGGKGGGYTSNTAPTTGGSGAGGTAGTGIDAGASSIQTDSGGAICYGNAGGSAAGRTEWQGGGGGGAGAVGGDAGANGGDGGVGLSFTISGLATYYGGGGGGGGHYSIEGTAGIGGLGGGGNGGRNPSDIPTAGAPNTGGGGGGQRGPDQVDEAEAADGGSGIVIIRYRN